MMNMQSYLKIFQIVLIGRPSCSEELFNMVNYYNYFLNKKIIYLIIFFLKNKKKKGYLYSYSNNKKPEKIGNGELPAWQTSLQSRIMEQHLNIKKPFDQMIINEYKPKQKISAHTDHTTYFDNIIVTLSLGSDSKMIFRDKKCKIPPIEFQLQPKTCVIMENDARYLFTHELSNNSKFTRISITWRHII